MQSDSLVSSHTDAHFTEYLKAVDHDQHALSKHILSVFTSQLESKLT
jgi:hypothetical protein